jgi:PAS domain S-box-containing protein
MSLQERLTMLVVISLLPLAALTIWFTVAEMRSATRLVETQLKFSASLVAAHQDLIVESAAQLLGAISVMPELRSVQRKGCERYFEQLRGRYPIYANIGLADLQGKVVCHANARSGDFNVADRSYFSRAVAERRFVMGATVFGRSTARWVIPFAQPVFDGARVSGAVFATLDLTVAGAALAGTELPTGARVAVADRRGVLLMEHPPASKGSGPRRVSVPAIMAAAQQMTPGSGEWDDPSGERRLYAFAPSHILAGEGFLASVSLDQAQVIGAALASLRYELLALAFALLTSGLAAWWVGGRMIVKPARQIVGTVRQLERGELAARVPLQAGAQRGEFARIASAFNLMAQSLQLRQADLEAELGRSRGAYSILDLVLNGMDEALVAVTRAGQLLMFNEAAARLFPLDGPALLPQQWSQHFGFYRPDGVTPYLTDDLPMVRAARGESGRMEQLVVRNARVPEGRLLQCSWQPIQGEGITRGALVVFTDVTELQRLQAEQAAQFDQIRELNASLEARIAERTAELARQGQLYRTLAEQAPEVVWHTDAQGRATFLNRAWYDLVGPDAGAGLGHAWLRRIHPDDVESVQRNWERSQETLAPYMGIRRILARDGSYHTMSYKAAPVFGDDGRAAFWVGIDADITEIKVIEAALRRSNRDLEAFSYSISHELRAPLGAIDGFAHALALKLEGNAEPSVAHYLSRVQAGVAKMAQSIEALLSLAQLVRAPLRYETVDLGAMAREILEGLQMQQPGRRAEVRVQDNLVAHGDARLLRLVMENLLGNAWKFTSNQDAALIEVGRFDGRATFYVRDNGAGFDMAYVGKLFGAFQRLHTEAEFPGTGIGLATVARIMERHQGTVWAQSQPGEGASFFFTLSESAPPPWRAGANPA